MQTITTYTDYALKGIDHDIAILEQQLTSLKDMRQSLANGAAIVAPAAKSAQKRVVGDTKTGRVRSEESRQAQAEKMRARWAEKKRAQVAAQTNVTPSTEATEAIFTEVIADTPAVTEAVVVDAGDAKGKKRKAHAS